MRHYTRTEWERVFDEVLGDRRAGALGQGIHEEVASPRYRVGSRMQLPDGRVFRYSRSRSATVNNTHCGMLCGSQPHISAGAIPACAIGSRTVLLDCADVVEENELENGWLRNSNGDRWGVYRILSNLATVANVIQITLAEPLPAIRTETQGIAAGDDVIAYPNIYSYLTDIQLDEDGLGVPAARGAGSVVCVPLMFVTPDYYFWGQTWGVISVKGGIWNGGCGLINNYREFYFDMDGQMVYRTGEEARDAHMQSGGFFLMNSTTLDVADSLAMLQLSP